MCLTVEVALAPSSLSGGGVAGTTVMSPPKGFHLLRSQGGQREYGAMVFMGNTPGPKEVEEGIG